MHDNTHGRHGGQKQPKFHVYQKMSFLSSYLNQFNFINPDRYHNEIGKKNNLLSWLVPQRRRQKGTDFEVLSFCSGCDSKFMVFYNLSTLKLEMTFSLTGGELSNSQCMAGQSILCQRQPAVQGKKERTTAVLDVSCSLFESFTWEQKMKVSIIGCLRILVV